MALIAQEWPRRWMPSTALCSILVTLLVCAAAAGQAVANPEAAQSSTAPITYIWPDCDATHPCVVHHIDTVGDGTASGETLQDFKFPMVPSSPGNLLLFTVMHTSSKAITVTDNNNGAWQTAVTTSNAADGETSELLYICGARAGTNLITVHLSEPAVNGEPLHFTYDEVSGIAPAACLDGTAAANGLTGTVQPGPVTTTSDGDMIFNFGEETYEYPQYDSPIGSVTTDGSAALLMENTIDKYASEVSLQAAHGSYTPTLYVNADPSPRNWNSVAAAFIPSTAAGTQPTGIHVTRILHYVGIVENAVAVPFPSSGNAIVISTSNPSDGNWTMTNLTDNAGHTYTRTPFAKVDTDPQIFSTCLGSGTGSQDLVISWIPSALNNHLLFYDIAGARTTGGSTGCVGATVNTVTGNQPSAPDAPISGDPVITPTTAGSLIIATSYFGTGPPSASLTPGVIFNSIYATGMIDPSNWDTGDPFAYVYATSTSPISFDWQMANNEEPNGGTYYDGAAIEILPADSVAPPPLSLTPASLPDGTVNTPYSAALAATGGQSPYTWSLMPGSSLPAGLQLNASTGVISGTPTASGTVSFTVQVTDSESTPATARANFSITIATVPPPLTITPAILPNGTVNVPYSAALAATGGGSPYTWSLAPGSSLPAGLQLNASGVISGTPTASGTVSFTVQVKDSQSTPATATASFSITIGTVPPPLTITPANLPNGTVNVPYSAALAATGGQSPYTWSLALGSSLPAGLQLNASTGVISGTPTASGTVSFTVQVKDSQSTPATTTASFSITIGTVPPPLTITPANLPSGTVNLPYSAALAATGGQSPYTWALATGSSLPEGLELNASTGVISGTPTASGTVSFTVQVTDSQDAAQTAMAGLSITISSAAVMLTASPTTISIASPGGSGSTTLTFANFTGSVVTVTCSGLPAESNSSVSNQTATSATLTITTTAPTTAALALPGSSRFSYALLLAALPLLIAGARRRRWPVQLCAVVLMLALGSLLGCGSSLGGGSSSTTTTRDPGTPLGTYPLTVTATSGNQSASLQLTLKVGQ